MLERRSLYILPTREGLYFGAMLGVILIAATNYANGLAYALAFLLASVLQHFFARYVSLNSFTETVLRTFERNEVARWPATPGKRPIL